ncbi:anti-sigma-K factor RskA [Duganella sp. 1411]|uniref:hypothetical protein n=1 Tax=Duganella sp. 1411 TaxID=2806572 RepID=UPI001AE59B65|nr:hypothetical protein [Duganella sp. 1411]MBP1203958.1 anti-sigma-K factor RskA [Duganella sp. 1411]
MATIDSAEVTREHNPMAASSDRDYVDAKLEAVESRMDGRVARIESALAASAALMEERSRHSDARMERIETALSEIRAETRSAIEGLKTTVIVTAISAVLAIVLGVAAFNATVLSNMVAAFEAGKNTSAAQAEVKRQTDQTAALLKKMQDEVNARHKPDSAGRN